MEIDFSGVYLCRREQFIISALLMIRKDNNMLKKRRVLSFVVICALFATTTFGSYATIVVGDSDAGLLEDSNSAVEKSLSNANSSELIQPLNAGALYYTFTKTSQSDRDTSAPVLKVSADVTGKGQFSTTFSKSTTRTLSISLSSEQESKIKASISGSYGTTLTSSVGVVVYKEESKTGYLAFQPYRRVIKGNLKTYNSAFSHINGGLIQTNSVTAKYPQKLASGQADGNYYVKYY